MHWACQFAGIIITPLNWRSTADELDYCIDNAEAKALVYEGVSRGGRARIQGRAGDRRGSRSALPTPATSPSTRIVANACSRMRSRAPTPRHGR